MSGCSLAVFEVDCLQADTFSLSLPLSSYFPIFHVKANKTGTWPRRRDTDVRARLTAETGAGSHEK